MDVSTHKGDFERSSGAGYSQPRVEFEDAAENYESFKASEPTIDGVPAIEPNQTKLEKGAVGQKNIGTYGSFVYVINQIFGPGVLAIPIVFQQTGWVVTILVLSVFTFISTFSATLLVESLRMIPGNSAFEKRYEYTTTVRHYYGKTAYVFFQIAMNICIQALNIASIIVCAQSMDALLIFCFNKTFALQLYPFDKISFIIGNSTMMNEWYASDGTLYLTIGYIIIMILCIPMGMVNLDENIKYQYISFGGLVVLMADFIIYFLFDYKQWDASAVPPFGSQYTQVVSVCIQSLAFVMLVPSWANEKKEHVSVNKTIWTASIVSGFGYIFIGILAALALGTLSSDDVLVIIGQPGNFILTRVSAYLFSVFIIVPGIPVYCITTRYNLYVGGICGRKTSFFMGVIAPWLVAFIFTAGPRFAEFLNWSALIFSGFVNFILPFILYITALKRTKYLTRPMSKIIASGVEDDEEQVPLFIHTKYPNEPLRTFLKPFPKVVRKFAPHISVVLLTVISILIIGQILVNLYYLIILKEDLLANSTPTNTSTPAANSTMSFLYSKYKYL